LTYKKWIQGIALGDASHKRGVNGRKDMIKNMNASSVLGGLLASVLALGAIGGAHAQADQKIVATEAFSPAAGWALETDDAFILMRSGCLEALGRIDYDGQLKPVLAESWTQTSPTEWDFKLRQGVKFQDGKELTAEIVGRALNALLTAAAPPRPFSPKRIESVTVIDDLTVRVTTPNPSVLLPYRLASPNTGILSPAAYTDTGINPLGHCTGPFEIVEHIPQQALKLKRNEAYWGGKVNLSEGELRFIPEGSGRATQLKTGEAQISTNLPISEMLDLKSRPGIMIETVAQARTTGLYLNNAKAPLDNMKVRQAIQSAIDTTAIAAAIYEGAARPAIGPFGPGEPWAPADGKVIAYDKERAKALLKEAGVDPASIKLNLLAYVERAELPDLAAVIQEQLGQIGITVELRVANYGSLEGDLMAGNFDMSLVSRGHLSDVADPIGFLTADYTCGGGFNLSQFCDEDMDAMIKEAAEAPSADRRYDLYRTAARRLQDDAITVFIVHQQRSDGFSKNVLNYKVHPESYYLFTPELAVSAN
jgi:peptide/nickel transport system substrate-binding protein